MNTIWKLSILSRLSGQVSRELDSLSHFFFTPLPVSREESATITSLPLQSLELEDVTPVGESGAAAMAPHQVSSLDFLYVLESR